MRDGKKVCRKWRVVPTSSFTFRLASRSVWVVGRPNHGKDRPPIQMNVVVIILLACVWVFLAFRAFQRGDMVMAGIFILVGVGLTVYRLRGR